MQFYFGATVSGGDDTEAGRLEHVLVDPTRREVTHIVVQSQRVSEDVLLPVSMVQGNTDHHILLHVPSADLEHMPRYYEGRTSSPPAGRIDTAILTGPSDQRRRLEDALNVAPDARQYGDGTRVTTVDDAEGSLIAIGTDQYTDEITTLWVRGLHDDEETIAGRWIGELAPDMIRLAATRDEIAREGRFPAAAAIPRMEGQPRQVEERNRDR